MKIEKRGGRGCGYGVFSIFNFQFPPKTKRAPFDRRPLGWVLRTSPLRFIGTMHIELCTSSPKNFRRTRNQRHDYGRNPPRQRRGPDRPLLLALWWKGGAGSRKPFKESCGVTPHKLYSGETAVAGLYCSPAPLPLSFLHGYRIRFLLLTATQKSLAMPTTIGMPGAPGRVLHSSVFRAD